MTKHAIVALLLLGIAIVILVLTRDSVDVNLIVYHLKSKPASFVYLGWLTLGVVIGALLK